MLRGVIGLGLIAGASIVRCPTVHLDDARRAAQIIGIDLSRSRFGIEDLRRGMVVELEHGPCGPGGRSTNITKGDLVMTARIAYAHLLERPDYYDRLARYVERG